ncbi:hypothetical protein phi5218_001 [Streptococcus phage phi5218]|nr:hypothetical protein phi5218_001 [Streptococcus phage phi5218]
MGIVKRPTVKQVFTIHDPPYALLNQNLSVGLFFILQSIIPLFD